ncbi:MAG: hypothetical protein ABWZ02_00265 [Nakamurella sp.]
MSSTSSSIVTPLESVSSSLVGVAPALISTVGLLVDGAADVVLGVASADDDSELVVGSVVLDSVVLDSVVFDDVVLAAVVLADVLAAAPAAAVPVTADAHAVSDTTDNNEIPARAALMDDRMMLFSQC